MKAESDLFILSFLFKTVFLSILRAMEIKTT